MRGGFVHLEDKLSPRRRGRLLMNWLWLLKLWPVTRTASSRRLLASERTRFPPPNCTAKTTRVSEEHSGSFSPFFFFLFFFFFFARWGNEEAATGKAVITDVRFWMLRACLRARACVCVWTQKLVRKKKKKHQASSKLSWIQRLFSAFLVSLGDFAQSFEGFGGLRAFFVFFFPPSNVKINSSLLHSPRV